ncbi:phenylacetate--CoA ligase family protein [Myroides phaeus]|uniref:Phenylacetate-CoA ligase n=1 Tax=Myroides phaeus TaxID=702745 RepID=A0A1G8CJS4_9FLAO|nr:phenylacetate--CoA ligase family protein [Myroides phaeus]SDH45453.1 phenylacetate-CoA ligase [Myroides phaeus]
MKEKFYKLLPDFFQNCLISIFNFLAYRQRYGGEYRNYFKKFENNRDLSVEVLRNYQAIRFSTFLKEAIANSNYYSKYNIVDLKDISRLPIISKEVLRNNIKEFYTIDVSKGIVSKTGGTTGKSLEVIYSRNNMQERFAMLDDFRNRFGYKLGKRTAWFSGKDLLNVRDLSKNRFWKTDYLYKVRYYSTFHIKEEYLRYYVEDLIKFQPEYFVGFPSTILEIAKYGLKHRYSYPVGVTKAIFPTAETITDEMRECIESFFKCKIYNQYASSEGAPFIFECSEGNLHLELQSGVFEVLDDNNEPSHTGRLVITSFTTEATPLIRYDIGDSITLEDKLKKCSCGNNNPLVKEILGRIDDFVFSPENGKINLGNVSNTLKDTKGIIRFQVIQNKLDSIDILLEIDTKIYSKEIESRFVRNWRDRIGNSMNLNISYVKEIPVEKSGKFRIVKNNIKHLIS